MTIITSHVFLTVEDDESISAVWLLLLITLLVGMGIFNQSDLHD